MKYVSILSLLVLIFSCSAEKKENTTESILVVNFLTDVTSLDSIQDANPIEIFSEEAKNVADLTMTLSKDSITNVLAEMKKFKHSVVITGNHTIVKITDPEDCTQSGSWGACMPMAEGYIKKGALNYKKDYINNIIGTPDDQERMVFLFDELG